MFKFELTEEQKQNIARREKEEAERTVGFVFAEDEAGNQYEKKAIFCEDWKVLSFGGYIEYYLDSLVEFLNDPLHNNATHFVIDVGGRNHKGIPGVQIPIGKFKDIVQKAVVLRVAHNKICS